MSAIMWDVKMGRPGGGGVTFTVRVYGSSPEQAKRAAEAQNPGYKAHATRRVPMHER